MLVVEEQFGALALDDQGIERREDVHQRRSGPSAFALKRFRRAQCSCLPAPSSATGTSSLRRTRASIRAPHRRLARRVEMADRIQADHALRAQGAVEQIGGDLRSPKPASAACPSRNAASISS